MNFIKDNKKFIVVIIFTFILFLIVTISNIHASDFSTKFGKLENTNPQKILFIGNSYLYYNDSLHNHFKRIVEEKNPNYDGGRNVKSATIGGSRLKHHNLDHLLTPKAISLVKKFDLVILQGGSGESQSKKERMVFSEKVKELTSKIKLKGSETALYMIHAYAETHKNFDPNLIRVIEKMYVEAGKKNNALVIPVGLAFENSYKKDPYLKLHKEDGTHPNLLGTYLAACVVYASIYKDNPIGIKYDYFGSVNLEDKLFLQKIAHETVKEFY
jgi:hypothetical protein